MRNLQSVFNFGIVHIVHLVSSFTKTTLMPDLTMALRINLEHTIIFATPLQAFQRTQLLSIPIEIVMQAL
jgi:hypothetical protein